MQSELTTPPEWWPIRFMSEPNAASVALIRGNEVLLIQRAFDPLKGLWTYPGGRREPGETIEETAIREIREEIGLGVSDLRPVTVLPLGGGFTLQVFATRTFSGDIVASSEIADYRWTLRGGLGGLPTTIGLDDVIDRSFAAVTEGQAS